MWFMCFHSEVLACHLAECIYPPDDHKIVESVVVSADEAKKHNLVNTINIHYEKIPPPKKKNNNKK